MRDIEDEVTNAKNFNDLFRLVKDIVENTLGKKRSSMMLGLSYLDPRIGAFHVVGSNVMVINKLILDALERMNIPKEKINHYIFSILLHEYIHSLGVTDEMETRRLTTAIATRIFGPNHPITIMTKAPLSQFPGIEKFILEVEVPKGFGIKYLSDFDDENARYYV